MSKIINTNKISYPILTVFVVIFISLILYTKSKHYIKSEYLDFKKQEFKSIVSLKIDKHPIKANEIHLNSYGSLRVQRDLFDLLKVGDSVIKKSNSDSIRFITSKRTIFIDENEFRREKYLNSLKN